MFIARTLHLFAYMHNFLFNL